MAGLPMPEMVAHAVAVPMTEAMHGEMLPKAVMVESRDDSRDAKPRQ